jgi:DNA-binding transcriptional MerR regulator
MEKSPEAFRTISEVADSMDLPQHVLRFWETRFPQIRPLKRAGGRRYYRPDDVERLRLIKRLLYDEGYTIKGVQRLFKEQGVQALTSGAVEPRLAFGAAEMERGPDLPAPALPEGAAPEPAEPLAGTPGVGDLVALRGALAEIAEAARILAQARSREP